MNATGKTDKTSNTLKRLWELKEEHKNTPVLLHLDGMPKVTITTTYAELYRQFEGLLDFCTKLKENESVDDLTLKPEESFGFFCEIKAPGHIGGIFDTTHGVMIHFPVEKAAEMLGDLALNNTVIFKRKNAGLTPA